MFAIGIVLFDKNGEAKKLKEEAERLVRTKLKGMNNNQIEMAKYHLWDGLSKLRNQADEKFFGYAPLYYLQLNKIISYYAKFSGVDMPATAKLYKHLNDDDFRKKYKLEGFKDVKFVKLVNLCLENQSLNDIEDLTNYVLKELGGFEIDGWVLKNDL